ncbi:putative RNA-directed DNA polymerase [Tanacetum coccineum]
MSGSIPPLVTGGGRGGNPLPTEDNPPVVLISNLDAGNPLRVHNTRNKYGFVDGTRSRDSYADSDVICALWDRCNAIVLTWIMNVVSNDVYMGLVYSENAANVWKELNETYDKVDGSVCVCPVKCSCATSTELTLHQQLMKLMQILMGLDDCYQPVRTALLTRDPLPDVKDAYATVSKEESHKGIPETSEAIDTKTNAISFAAKSYNQNKKGNTNNFNRNNNRGNGPNYLNRVPNPNLVCKNCGFTGHTIERCYELIRYPPGYKKGHNASMQNVFKPNFNANCDNKGSDKQPTACNSPTSFTTEQMQKLLNLINDSSSENTQANMAGTGSESGGLYLFDDIKNNSLGNVNTVMAFNVSKDLWHSRLGHPVDQVLNVLKNDLNLSKNTSVSVCETCHRAKQTREPFPLSNHKSEKPGELVHLDLWGPYRVSSIEGFKYFLTIVDDYSRAVWTYLLKTKDEVFDCFVNFIKLIHNQFNATIKTIRSDNGTEFVNKKMFTLFSDLGIIHHTSCTHTPQQNGIAERKHRHLLNVARSLMFQGGIPLNFWSDCILTAVYLINKLPSSVLNVISSHLDVRFYETVFPFKMKNTKRNDLANVEYTSDDELLTLFDNQIPPSPNDEERATPCVEGRVHSSSDAAPVQSLEENFATHIGDNILSEGNVQDENLDLNNITPSGDHNLKEGQPSVRRSSRPTKMPAKFNDFTLDSKLKYGIEKHVNYFKLNTVNYCFATTLNKSVKPTTYYEDVKDVRWVEAMNNEIKALVKNNTWTLTDLLIGKKTIDNKWLYKIKCKASGQVDKYKARLDANNVFLYGDLNKDIYMSLPRGFECSDKTKVCKLNKALYGLRQAQDLDESKSDKFLKNIFEYQKLLGKLICLTHTRPDISYAVHCLSQHMHAPLQSYLKVALRVIRYLKNSPGQENLCLAIMCSLESLLFLGKARNKPLYPDPLQRLNTDVWQVPLVNSAIQIATNLVFHERTKHFKVDVHLVREKVQDGVINTIKVASVDQTENLFTKGHGTSQHLKLCNQLSLVDMFGKTFSVIPLSLEGLILVYCESGVSGLLVAEVVDLVLLGSFGGVFGAIGDLWVQTGLVNTLTLQLDWCGYNPSSQSSILYGGGRGGNPLPTEDNPPVVLISNLDAGNPLHNVEYAMKLALQARNKYGFVDGTRSRDSYADSDVLCAQWDRCNAMVLTWIMNVVSNDVYMGLVYSENAADVWKELNETYDKVDGYVVYNLLQKIGSVKQGGSTVADYYHRLNSLWREFDAITKLPKCVCPVKSCWTALITRDLPPSIYRSDVKDAYATVSREEFHRGIPDDSVDLINVTSGTRDTGTGETWHKGDYNSCGTTVWHSRLGHPADQSLEENSATHIGDNILSEGNVQDENLDLNNIDPSGDHNLEEGRPSVRRSSRPTKMAAKWVEAINNEIEALIKNNTWTLTDLPIGKKTIDNKWLYKIKYKASGQVDKYKARVVAKGFSQREGIDFDETFSLVVKMLDMNNAFLYGDLNEDIYMSLPLGFECSDKNKVYKLNKALYGLKQAPRQWNAKLTTVLAKHGFVQSKFDYSLYIKHNDNVFVTLLVYVDDFIITYNSLYEIENFKLFLKSNFMIKDLAIMKYFLGIKVLENSNGICMTQRKYCLELIHEFGLLVAKPVTTPLPENYVLAVDESKSDKFLKNIFKYQKLLGKLIYLTHTRPDISYVVHCLSQHMHAPLQSHLKVALRVIRYLKNSPGTGIQIYKDKNLKLSCFIDSDRAKCLRTRKFVSGYCVFFRKSLVSWKSKKQNTVSRSSVEAEYRCMASATYEIIWISNLLNDLCITNLLPV